MGLFGFTCFVIIKDIFSKRIQSHNLFLTISGQSKYFYDDDNQGKMSSTIKEIMGDKEIQRIDHDNAQVQLRLIVRPEDSDSIIDFMEELNKKLPHCNVSYVNLNTLL